MEWRSFVKRSVSSTRRTSRKSLLHFLFFSRKLVLVACGFIISSNRVDFRKSYFLIFISVIINSSYFAVLNTSAHLRSYEVEKAIWFESNEQSCLDSVTLRYVSVSESPSLLNHCTFFPPFIPFNPPDCLLSERGFFFCCLYVSAKKDVRWFTKQNYFYSVYSLCIVLRVTSSYHVLNKCQ